MATKKSVHWIILFCACFACVNLLPSSVSVLRAFFNTAATDADKAWVRQQIQAKRLVPLLKKARLYVLYEEGHGMISLEKLGMHRQVKYSFQTDPKYVTESDISQMANFLKRDGSLRKLISLAEDMDRIEGRNRRIIGRPR